MIVSNFATKAVKYRVCRSEFRKLTLILQKYFFSNLCTLQATVLYKLISYKKRFCVMIQVFVKGIIVSFQKK